MNDFPAVRVFKNGTRDFKITNTGHLRTLRIDNARLHPDYSQSKNILGHTKYQGSTYIHLGKASESRLILTDKAQKTPFISSCNFIADSLAIDKANGKIIVSGRKNMATEVDIEVANLPDNWSVDYKN